MGTLTVKAYLPNDTGGPGELAPLIEATVIQCTICNQLEADYPYFRSSQGNSLVFPRMFRRVGYSLEVRELGGEGRTVHTGGTFPVGALTRVHTVVFPTTGTVEVLVLDGTAIRWRMRGVKIGNGLLFTPATDAWRCPVFRRLVHDSGAKDTCPPRPAVSADRSQPLRFTLNLGRHGAVAAEAMRKWAMDCRRSGRAC